jgi:hypothetical protein
MWSTTKNGVQVYSPDEMAKSAGYANAADMEKILNTGR